MEPVIYDNDFLHKHSLWPKCGCGLNDDISNRDYPGTNYFDRRIDALDVDLYEAKLRRGQSDKTADAVIGIESCNNKTRSNPRLLVIELRLDFKSSNGISVTSVIDKIDNTKQILGGELPINNESILVYSDNVAPAARSYFDRYKRTYSDVRKIVVYSVSQFNTNVKSYEEMPYDPINKYEVVSGEFRKLIEAHDWLGLLNQVNYWLSYAIKIKYANTFEYENISSIIVEEWKDIRSKYSFDNDDIEILAEIVDEDVDAYFNK